MRFLDDASFGVCTFCGDPRVIDHSKFSGLPNAPASVRIFGRFERLKNFRHPNLCRYLDCIRGKYDQIFLVSEIYQKNLSDVFFLFLRSTQDQIQIAFDFFSALQFLHSNQIFHRFWNPKFLYVFRHNRIRIGHYGLFFLTNEGKDVEFPIGFFKYLPPECVLTINSKTNTISSPKQDIWSIGIILFELITGRVLWKNLPATEIISKITNLTINCETNGGNFLFELIKDLEADPDADADLKSEIENSKLFDVVKVCLQLDPQKRPNAMDLLQFECFKDLKPLEESSLDNLENSFDASVIRSKNLSLETLREFCDSRTFLCYDEPWRTRPIEEIYHLWKLAGSDIESILWRKGHIKSVAAVQRFPNLTVDEFDIYGREAMRERLTDLSMVPLSLDLLEKRLTSIPSEIFFPVLEILYENGLETKNSDDVFETSKLPVVIKERDIEYQLRRQILFHKLLISYPHKRSLLWHEARIDIPPLFRGLIWAALLNVQGDIVSAYQKIDKESPNPTDRQIEVDVPRCHQYDELLSSPEAHKKLKRILKAWILANPQYVYWQGLDSLCAPFLALNFSNEPLIFACFSAFIPKYLYNFFLKNNSDVIHEYLAIFSHFLAFHDPQLNNHLQDIGFNPELYAIPWFLTMFAHVFPLHKIYHLWDTLLLGNHSFPLCVGIAILMQLRIRLLKVGFNECILLFSDMPEIDIEKCVDDSIKVFCNTPKSAAVRRHAPPACSELKTRRSSASFIGYEVDERSELGMSALPLETLRADPCIRICAAELIDLCGLNKQRRSSGSGASGKVLVIDIRSPDEFSKGTFPNAVNISFLQSFVSKSEETTEFRLPSNFGSEKLKTHRGLIVIMGSKNWDPSRFANELIRRNFPKVSVLDKGFEVFLYTDIICLPYNNS